MIKNLKHIVVLLTLIWQAHLSSAQDTIPLNSTHSFAATFKPGYTYSWWYTNPSGVRTDFVSISNKTEEILWDTEGNYTLFSQAKDAGNCLSEIIAKNFVVYLKDTLSPFTIYAGPDTVNGSCQPYVFAGVYPNNDNYTYSWEPGDYLSDSTIPNPVFTPGQTTTYRFTVTTLTGYSYSDTVTITVSEILANAGDDIFMLPGTNAILDGTASIGENLTYRWTTHTGEIKSSVNTPNPVISSFGVYFLEVTDAFGCVSTDSVNVSRMAFAPVANNDYYITNYQTEVIIPILDNDTDEENSIVPSSLTITKSPASGTAYVDFDNFTIHYRPNTGFSGEDNFEYRICNASNNCDEATVFVIVTDYKFLVPNAFSPNGDGINDYFEILGIEFYDGNSFTIFNRWGNKVYEAKNYGISTSPRFWDGKANTGFKVGNEELTTGTYFYILDLGNGEKPIGGSIYLDR